MSVSAPSGSRIPKSNIAGAKVRQVPNFTPEMMTLFNKLLGGTSGGIEGGLGNLSKLASGDEEAFGRVEAPAYSALQGALGQIGSRFAGAGAIGSSAFQNATSGAAQSLAENLGSQRQGLQQGALDRLLGLSSSLLGQRPYENLVQEDPQGFDWGGLLGMLGGSLFGPAAGAFGKSAGSYASKKLFG